MKSFTVKTPARQAIIDITDQLRSLTVGTESGIMTVYTPHTTTGLTINEGADPDVVRDILHFTNRLIPQNGDFRHTEGNSDAHIKASFFGSSVQIIIEGGQLILGTWQHVFLCEFDGPRTRTIHTKIIS